MILFQGIIKVVKNFPNLIGVERSRFLSLNRLELRVPVGRLLKIRQ